MTQTTEASMQPKAEATYLGYDEDGNRTEYTADADRVEELKDMGNQALAYALDRKLREDPHAKYSMDIRANETGDLGVIYFPENPDYDADLLHSAQSGLTRTERLKLMARRALWGDGR